MRVSGEGRQEPIHVRLRQRPGSLDEEVRKESLRVQRVVPVDLSGVDGIESHLHDDGPNVDAYIEYDDDKQANLSPPPLTDSFHIKDEAKAEASDTMRG